MWIYLHACCLDSIKRILCRVAFVHVFSRACLNLTWVYELSKTHKTHAYIYTQRTLFFNAVVSASQRFTCQGSSSLFACSSHLRTTYESKEYRYKWNGTQRKVAGTSTGRELMGRDKQKAPSIEYKLSKVFHGCGLWRWRVYEGNVIMITNVSVI